MQRLNLKPNPLRVIIKVDEPESKIGNYATLNIDEEQATATVMRVGDRVEGYEEGDKIIFGAKSGVKFEYQDVEYKLLYPEEIYFTIEHE